MKIFKQIHLYKILIQEISTIFTDLMSTCLFPKKRYILRWHQNFQRFTTLSDNPPEQGKI